MKLIIGLGNPGEKYRNNRHNVGYMVADKLSKTQKLKNSKQVNNQLRCKIFKSDKFMNESGNFVKKLTSAYAKGASSAYSLVPNDLYIVHDDLDIPLGSYKIQFGKGPKVHRGLQSIEEALDTADFWRVRVGVENRKVPQVSGVPRVPRGEKYVLQDFTKEEKVILDKVIGKVCKEISHLRE